MTDFIRDNEQNLPDGKSDYRPATAPAGKSYTAAEWNKVQAALYSIQDWINGGGDFTKFVSDAGDAVDVSAAGFSVIRNKGNALEASVNGRDFISIVPAKGRVAASSVGILITNTASQNSDAIEAWLASLGPSETAMLEFDRCDAGEAYAFARTIALQRQIVMRGGGPGGLASYSSYLTFPANTTGIWIKSYQATAPYGRGDNVRLEGLTLVGLSYGGSTSGHGILMEGRASISNCWATNFGGHGLSIEGRSGDGTNANLFRVDSSHFVQNHGDGVYIDGADANAGVFINVNTSSNDGYGFNDSSFLGNTYLACHTDANVTGSYKCDDTNARSLYLGCYVEGGQALPDIGNSRSVWLGGLSEGGLLSGFGLIDQRWTHFQVGAKGNGNTGIWNYLQFGSQASEGEQAYMRLWNEDWAGASLTLKYDTTDNFFDWYCADYGTAMQRIAAPLGAVSASRHIPGAALLLPQEFYLGTSKIKTGTAAPTTGTWHVGDRVLESTTVAAGAAEGWICTAAGTQGTYDSARTVTANGSTTITFSGTETRFRVGDYLTINAITARVVSINTTTYLSAVMSASITAGSGLAITYANATFKQYGAIAGTAADDTASPGAATQNTRNGRVAIAAAASSVTVTNDKVTASSIVTPVLQTIDATLTSVPIVVCSSGSFTIYGNANATAAVNVGWVLQ